MNRAEIELAHVMHDSQAICVTWAEAEAVAKEATKKGVLPLDVGEEDVEYALWTASFDAIEYVGDHQHFVAADFLSVLRQLGYDVVKVVDR